MLKHAAALPDFANSVVAVPPVAWTGELRLAEKANRDLIRHIEAGGVDILLYGGNANLYHFDLGRFADLAGLIAESAAPGTAVIPSIGPDFGKAMDEIPILRRHGFAEVMMLPIQFPFHPDGLARSLRLVADALGHGLILYIKRDGYLPPATVETLVADGTVRFVKYAVEREAPETDSYLDDLVSAIGRERMASGMGETPIHVHLPKLLSYTSGAVCIAPRAAMALLRAYGDGDIQRAETLREPFLRFEQIRAKFGGIAVLHDAVTLSGIADMGPILPMLANLTAAQRAPVAAIVKDLIAIEKECLTPA